MAIKDGGPAFPGGERWRTVDLAGNEENYSRAPFQRGLSLRDYFAAKALPELIRQQHSACLGYPADWRYKCALEAYEFADAMLAAREVPHG